MQARGTGHGEVERLAAAQRWLITRRQLSDAGISSGTVAHWLARGRLHRRHPGVFLLGRPTLEPLAGELAAVLLFAGDALLTHRSAAALWGLLDSFPVEPCVTVVARDARSRPGVTVHRAAAFDSAEQRVRSGIPVSSPARTVIDLAAAATTTTDELEQAVGTARAHHLLRPGELDRALDRHAGRRGTRRLRALLTRDPAFTRSQAERRLLKLLRDARLPAPRVNGHVLGMEVDFLWPAQRVVVELDGYETHGTRRAFEGDRRRDATLQLAGQRTIRVTHRWLTRAPDDLERTVKGLLSDERP